MGEKTFQAWQGLQAADNQLSQTQFPTISSRFSQQAYLYSTVNLSGVDPILKRHFKDTIVFCQETAQLYAEIETRLMAINQRTEAAAGLGALLGAAGSDGYNPRGDAAAGALLFGMFGAASQQAEQEEIIAQYQSEIQQNQEGFKKICDMDKVVAEKLSKKYGLSFFDPF